MKSYTFLPEEHCIDITISTGSGKQKTILTRLHMTNETIKEYTVTIRKGKLRQQ